MPKRVDTNDLRQAHPKKVDKRDEDTENVFQIPSSDESDKSDTPVLSDSTYNLEDDITPPVITPMQLSKSGTETSDSLEGNESNVSQKNISPHLPVMPSTSTTRALNIEFNRCLLLNIEPADDNMAPSDSTRRENLRNAVRVVTPVSTFSLHENIQEENEESSKSDEIIQVNAIHIEACKECEEDSKATDADVPDIPDDTCATLSATSLDVDAEMQNELIEDGGISQNERMDLVTESNDERQCNL